MRRAMYTLLSLVGGILGLYLWLLPDSSTQVAVLDPVRTPAGIEAPSPETRTVRKFAETLEVMTPGQAQALGVVPKEQKGENENQSRILQIDNPIRRTEFADLLATQPNEMLTEIQVMLKNPSMQKPAIEGLQYWIKIQPNEKVVAVLEQAAHELGNDDRIEMKSLAESAFASVNEVRHPPKSIVEQIAEGTLVPEPAKNIEPAKLPSMGNAPSRLPAGNLEN